MGRLCAGSRVVWSVRVDRWGDMRSGGTGPEVLVVLDLSDTCESDWRVSIPVNDPHYRFLTLMHSLDWLSNIVIFSSVSRLVIIIIDCLLKLFGAEVLYLHADICFTFFLAGIGWMPEARTNKQKFSPFYMT